MRSAKYYLDLAKDSKKLLMPLLWMGFCCAAATPILAIFHWTWGLIFGVSSFLSFLIRGILTRQIDNMYILADKSQREAEENAIREAEEAIQAEERRKQNEIRQKEEQRRYEIQQKEREAQNEIERKQKEAQKLLEEQENQRKEAERRLKLEKDPYCELSLSERLIVAVAAVLYKSGVDVYSNNRYGDHINQINNALFDYGLCIDKLDGNYLHVRLDQKNGESLTFIFVRHLRTSVGYYNNDSQYVQIIDQYGNILYKEECLKFNKRVHSLLEQIKTNWSDNVLVQKAYDIMSSLISADEEMLPQRLQAPDVDEELQRMEKEGLNG